MDCRTGGRPRASSRSPDALWSTATKPQGVLAVFSRRKLPDSTNNWLRLFANHAAVAIGNARAFEEIERLKARLEEENHYLREEVTSALGGGDMASWEQSGSEESAATDPARRAHGRRCACHRRERHREGTRRPRHAREQPAPKDRALIKVNCGAVPETLVRKRVLRPRQRRVHRRDEGQARTL
jgi:hypothetical protein